jgi:trimeric autotransporter adhesin
VGVQALNKNTSGSNNTATGLQALYLNTSGSNNTAFGLNALFSNVTGSNNTAVGASADVLASNLNNATALGSNTYVNASNKVVIGSNTAGMVIGGYANWSNLSDGRFKENIQENVPGLDFITRLRPVTYNINTKKLDEYIMQLLPDSIRAIRMKSDEEYDRSKNFVQTGFIAQEVEKAAASLGYRFDGVNVPKNSIDTYSISYGQFVMPLVKAVQEQQQQIDHLKKENVEIKQILKQKHL